MLRRLQQLPVLLTALCCPCFYPAVPGPPVQQSSAGETDSSNEGEPTAGAATGAEETAAAASGSRSEGGASESAVSVSTSIAAAAAASEERVLLFGGCLDLSSFLSLTRNYVQSKETWLLDLNKLT